MGFVGEPLVVDPIDGLVWAPPVRAVVGGLAMRAGRDGDVVEEFGRRLLLRLAPGEGVYAACTARLPGCDLAVVMATDRRLLGTAGTFDRWTLDAPWSELETARITPGRFDDLHEIVVAGVAIRLTGQPKLGAASLIALASHILAGRQGQ